MGGVLPDEVYAAGRPWAVSDSWLILRRMRGHRRLPLHPRDFGGTTPSSRVLRPIDAQDADQVEMPAPSVDQPDRQRTSSARTECCCETVLNRELRAVVRQGESSPAADRAAVTHDDRAPAGIAEGMKVGEWFGKA
ncbi:hypothetical protein PUR28_16435 [Streptomyces sp. BE308]|uniref:hypothetical protein n=1 Tax=Streptomyces sp. BE308 TaxID=3002529 RepID=UPI002E788518|nr:hypothetical protein [Streptomyces sp. BE308]MEE1792336.1 hypothetical protein [Streptomyces sp. BE308]